MPAAAASPKRKPTAAAASPKKSPMKQTQLKLGTSVKKNTAQRQALAAKSPSPIKRSLNGQMNAAGSLPPRKRLEGLLAEAYVEAVTAPKALNKYKPFSHEVYGETNYGLTDHIVSVGKITGQDVFFDLGSGIGQVVLQVAATTGCRACGIELMPIPAQYADPFCDAFASSLAKNGYQFPIRPTFIEGSFLEEYDVAKLADATFIFVNNFAFPVALAQQLGEYIEATCSVGTRVLSYKPLAWRRTRGGRVRQGLAGAKPVLLETGRGVYERDGVSWTDKAIEYIQYELR